MPLGLTIATYLDGPKDAVTLNVRMDQLNDGTVYASAITLDAPAKNILVAEQDSGYRKMN
jgi:hypothetical protein